MTDQASRAGEPVGMSLVHMVWGQAINQAVYVVARLGIADLLQDGEKTAEELAAAVGADPVNLGRVLRALTTLGVFREDEAGRFTVGPEGARLAADHPRSLRAMALMILRRFRCRIRPSEALHGSNLPAPCTARPLCALERAEPARPGAQPAE